MSLFPDDLVELAEATGNLLIVSQNYRYRPPMVALRKLLLDGVIGDAEYYRVAMHGRAYIAERWSTYFEVVAIVDAIAGLQDFVVLRRR